MIFHKSLSSISNKIDIIVLLSVIFLLQVTPSEETHSCGDRSDNLWSETAHCDKGMVALVLGASGETGSQVVRALVQREEFVKVILVNRRQLQFPDERQYNEKIVQHIVDFDNLSLVHSEVFRGVDTAFCCLGTTRRIAGSEGFVKVDHDYVLAAATLLKQAGCPEFHLLTSTGAKASSWLLYPSTKGKVEEAVKRLGFNKLSIYRPGLLLCARNKTRFFEEIFQTVSRAVDRAGWWSVTTEVVARVMVDNSVTRQSSGAEILEHMDIVTRSSEGL